jgi:hypothetical protein
LAVPARLGEPWPMSVLQQIERRLARARLALAMRRSTASTSWPSIGADHVPAVGLEALGVSSMNQGATCRR